MSDVEQSENQPFTLGHEESQDWLLESLIHTYASNGVEISITLNVGGSIITGKLTGGKKYFQSMAEILRGVADNAGLGEHLAADFAGLGEEVYGEKEEAGEKAPPAYIHLANARIVTGNNNQIPTESILWRGKISSVDGFFIGTIEQ